MRVTAMDSGDWPLEGYVVAHHPSQKACWDAYQRALANGEPRQALHHVFLAGPKVRTGAEMLAAIERLEAVWPLSADTAR